MPAVHRHPPFSLTAIATLVRGCTLTLPWLALAFALPSHAQAVKATPAVASTPADIVPGERLSTWLTRRAIPADAYFLGLSWNVPEEQVRQRALRQQLMLQAAALPPTAGQSPAGLVEWLRSLEATGRVALGIPDPQWLVANPAQDPVLQAGQSVVVPRRPTTVSVVLESGKVCQVAHRAGATAWQYLAACTPEDAGQRDVTWVIQPDGTRQRLGVGLWNAEAGKPLAPGAWIWAPARQSQVPEAFSERLSAFLATQGPAPDAPATALTLPPNSRPPLSRNQDLTLTANDWGEIGLLQMPSARMEKAGNFRFHASRVAPYTRGSVMF
ncbi:MAG: capsule biosynthesis GfcC family protein, partial [Comamonas sp.]